MSVPGVPCPSCTTPIVMSMEQLLSGNPVHCTGCGLKLSVDRERSAEALAALQELQGQLAATQSHSRSV